MYVNDTYQLIARDKDVKRGILVITNLLLAPEFSQCASIFDITPIWQSLEPGNKARYLLLPIVQSGSRSYDQKRTPDIMSFC
jgi:hypothetical protein